ncbi:MAG TPA: ABC transporter permease [Xanthobacteraceae bacterium]|nr:ABC transporter permease [Xanthobacteraceae bacterium]
MTMWECIGVAIMALGTHGLRSLLTTLGIVIGVASVIVMVAVGTGARTEVERQINSLGTNLLQIQPGSSRISGRAAGSGTSLPLSEGDVVAIKDQVPGVQAITGTLTRPVPVVSGNMNWLTSVNGVHADYFAIRDWEPSSGRVFDDVEAKGGARVAVIGATVAQQMFGQQDPRGAVVRVLNTPFTVIGVLEPKGQSTTGRDQDDLVLIPMTTARMVIVTRNKLVPTQVGAITVKLEPDAPVAKAKEEIEQLLRERRRVQAGREDDFFVRDLAEYLRTRAAAQQTFGLLLGATAAISLIVGGIGIMNIMLVSVTERTREIGLRRAVGARQRDIMMQFLVEAVSLCMLGGLIGLALGVIGTALIAFFAQWPVLVNAQIIALAIVAAAATGIFFGFYPARRAAALKPIEALRME